MTKTRWSRNKYGGLDAKYTVHCDICDEPLGRVVRKGHKSQLEVREFSSWGEGETSANVQGWLVEGKTAICTECLKSIRVEDEAC